MRGRERLRCCDKGYVLLLQFISFMVEGMAGGKAPYAVNAAAEAAGLLQVRKHTFAGGKYASSPPCISPLAAALPTPHNLLPHHVSIFCKVDRSKLFVQAWCVDFATSKCCFSCCCRLC